MSNATQRVPAPFVFAASQYFEGPDGQWSSFVVRAGTPEQSFRVLPSTVTSEIFVPMSGACKAGTPSDCAFSRGAELYQGKTNDGFLSKQSSTWHEIGVYKAQIRPELGYNASGLYGLDSVGLMIANSGGPTLQNQVVAAVVNPRFWVGRLGMDVKPSNFSEFANPQRSLIKTLHEEKFIPGLNYGYTAGAYYKKPSAYGSLVYGGYDQSRFVPNNISFPFDANDSRKPSVNIQSIVTRDLANTTVSILKNGTVYSLIDFAESHMWLPVSACDAFARAFNLTYDNSTDLYLVDARTRSRLLEKNPSITFGLGTTANPGERVNIVLPYSAFDQQATYPIYPNATNYFPIRRAYNETQYTIGRTFFQEAYVKIDYDRGNFSVHQALFPASNEKQEIIAVASPEAVGMGAKSDLHGVAAMSKGAIAGIAVGVVLATALLSFLIFWLCRRRRMAAKTDMAAKEEGKKGVEVADQPKVETEGAEFFEKDSRPFAEMEARHLHELRATFCKPGEFNAGALHELQTTYFKPEELDGGGSRVELGAIVELYEMDDTDVVKREGRDLGLPATKFPPPGWI